MLDPKSFGYNLGRLLADMPEYILVYGATKPIAEKVGTKVLGTKLATTIASKAPFLAKTIAFLSGTAAQTATGFLPQVFEKTLDYSTKTENFAYSKEGDLLAENLDSAKPLTEIAFKNLPRGYAYTWVEVASESAGEGITYLKKGLLSRFFAKHADETVEATIDLAKTLGWNGILEEIAEEELANLGQAPIEGQPVNLPFVTKEGTERLILETVGIGIMGTVMQTPANAYNKAQYNKAVNQIKTQGKELGMSDAEIDSVITDIQKQLEQPKGEKIEEAVPPVKAAGAIEEKEPEEITEEDIKKEMEKVEPSESQASATLKSQGIEVTDESEAIENIRTYMQTQGDTSQTGFVSKAITDKTIETLKNNPIGVDELTYDDSGNITLYRSGNVMTNKPNSYSLEQGEGQVPYIISKDEVLVNTNSKQIREMIEKIYKDTGAVKDYLEALNRWNALESEVIAVPKEVREVTTEVAPKAKQPETRDIMEEIRIANPVLFREARKAATVEQFIEKMSGGKPETVSIQVLTDFYNKVNKAPKKITKTAQKKATGLTNKQVKELTTPKVSKGLTLKPSKAVKPEEIVEEAKKLGTETSVKFDGKQEVSYKKPLIGKTELKTIFKNSSEFRNNPVLTVEEYTDIEGNTKKVLTFNGKRDKFKIVPKAMQLNPDNLTVGDKIYVDEESFKEQGASVQPRVYKGGTSFASFASEDNFITPNQVRENLGMEEVKPIEFPELVKMAQEIVKSTPAIKKPRARAIGVPAGLFTPVGDGKVTLNPDIFKDAKLMERVLGHELRHAVDYVPDKTMARGNLLGRLASLRGFMRETFTDLATEERVDQLKREQSRLQGERAALKDKEGNITNKDQYASLGKELTPINKEIEKIKKSAPYKNEKILEELKNITQLWNPFPETLNDDQRALMAKQNQIPVSMVDDFWKKYVDYRYSAPELYAEAESALFNMPDVLKLTAPNFYKGFFENLDSKPDVKDSYFKIQELLSGGSDILSSRQKTIRDSFQKGEDLIRQQREEKKNRDKEYTFRLRYELIDKNSRVIDMRNKDIKEGKYINPDDDPVYWLEAHNYVGGIAKNFVEDYIQPLYEKVKKNDISWEDLGEVLFLERVIKERGDIPNPVGFIRENDPISYDQIKDSLPEGIEGKSTTEQIKILKQKFGKTYNLDGESLYDEITATFPKGLANPFGMTNETAQTQLNFLKEQLGTEKWSILQQALEGFRESTNYITKMAAEEGFWKPELLKQIAANPAYAAFQVLDYVKEFVPASISHQVGTLKDIANPADATVAKDISIIRAIERNKVKKKIVKWLNDLHPDEITEARYGFDGKRRVPLEPKDTTKQALFTTIEDGVVKGYYVDPYIAKTMEFSSTGEANAVMEVFKLFNSKLFRPLFITFNVGFQTFNLFRDFFRFYKNIGNMTIPRALRAYARALPSAYRRAWNISDETIKEMEKSKIIGVTYNDVIQGATTEDKRIDALLARSGVTKLKSRKLPAILKPINAILSVIEQTGNMIETLPKVAAYKELNGTMPTEQLASLIRTSVGSPDFLRKGASYKVYNEVFLFSNSIKEGMRSDIAIATNPKTRAGWWIKTAKLNIIPKLLMWAAMSGLFGEALRKMFEDVSEYDKTNYTVIPIGEDETGKTIYIRIPQDETGRFIGGVFWKMLRAMNNNKPAVQDLTDLLSFTGGQIPTINPLITAVTGVTQYMAGKNPYDYFRGRNVIPDQEFKAGGKYAFKPFANWMLQTVGLGAFMSGYVSEQTPETKTWIQKVVETPILSNIIGRWIKISDYGQTEKNRQIVEDEERETAKRLLEERRKLEDAVKEYQSGAASVTRKSAIIRQLTKDVVGDPPYAKERKTKATLLKKKFNIAIIKGTADANVTSLIYANTNAEKLALLREIKTDMSNTEFLKLKNMLINEGIVSKDVFKELQ